MSPDGWGTELVALGATVLASLGLAVGWDRVNGWLRIPLRAAAGVICVLTALATGLVWVNRQIETYPSWADLFHGEVRAASTADAPPHVRPTDASGGRIITFTAVGKASGLTLPIMAYLPPGYDSSGTTRFPVIEAFHGFPGSPLTWVRRLHVARYLDQEISAGRMAPTVVLFPYQTPDPSLDTECTDLVHGPHTETYLTVDVPTAAKARLRIRTDQAGWGLIGYSAGGFCAANLLLRHPSQYAAAASLSGYAEPGITIGDGSEDTSNNVSWRLRHLPVPAVALYLACARTDSTAFRNTQEMAGLARAPMSVTTAYLNIGGHNAPTWEAMEAPAFDWLSSWLGRPV